MSEEEQDEHAARMQAELDGEYQDKDLKSARREGAEKMLSVIQNQMLNHEGWTGWKPGNIWELWEKQSS